MSTTDTQNSNLAPYSLRVKDAEEHFGFKEQTLYQWISNGRLQRGKHYLKVGGRIVIVREEFIKFLIEEDGNNGSHIPEA